MFDNSTPNNSRNFMISFILALFTKRPIAFNCCYGLYCFL